MGIFRKILSFLGFSKDQEQQGPDSPLRSLLHRLRSISEEARALEMKEAEKKSREQLSTLDGFKTEPPADPVGYLQKFQEHFEVLTFIFQHSRTEEGNLAWREGVDGDYETLLEMLPDKLYALKKPYGQTVEQVEAYIKQFEEYLLLADARAEFKFQISENQKWIAWPFLSKEFLRPSARHRAEGECRKIFLNCPALQSLEFDRRVPMLPISFLDIQKLPAQFGVNVADFANNKFYTYLV